MQYVGCRAVNRHVVSMTLSLLNFGVGFRKVVRRLLEEQDKVLRS